MSEDNRVLSNKGRMSVILAGLFLSLSMVTTTVLAEQATETEASIIERIKPLGVVATTTAEAQQASPVVEEPAPVAASGPMSAEQVFNSACMACHATGAAGAPKVGDVAAWAPRIAQGAEVLFEHAIKGFKAMPPRGGSAQLSDEEVRAAIDFMVEKSQ